VCADFYFWMTSVRIAIGVAYRGAGLNGWQSQPSGNTVQDHLERALSEIAGERIDLVGAGRTDAGVHAVGQVAHFDTAATRPRSAWVRGVNSLLGSAIAVEWASPVAEEFHARYSAITRSYRYVLYNHLVRPAVLADLVGWYPLPLNLEHMQGAADCLLGERDFSSFRSAECQAKNPVRIVERAQVHACGPYVLFDFTANAFLHHMVRNIVGCIVYVGRGEHPPEWLAQLIAARDRQLAAPTFSAAGLYLSQVCYAAHWGLPAFPRMLPFDSEPGQ
jgi:tRNA pseudouridine38-40 synthase